MTHVLIVEDDFDIREVLGDLLSDEGYDVIKAAHGAEALAMLKSAEALPRLILLDLMMPVMNGWQFIAEKETVPQLASIPVIILSADDDLPRKAMELKVRGFFRKPIELERLLKIVAEICRETPHEPTPPDPAGV